MVAEVVKGGPTGVTRTHSRAEDAAVRSGSESTLQLEVLLLPVPARVCTPSTHRDPLDKLPATLARGRRHAKKAAGQVVAVKALPQAAAEPE
eukprot:3721929-Rhodomonas_salina.1